MNAKFSALLKCSISDILFRTLYYSKILQLKIIKEYIL